MSSAADIHASYTAPARSSTETSAAQRLRQLVGGIQGGRVVGASDAKGGEPADNAKSPQDVLATMYRHLGIDTSVSYEDRAGRPVPVLPHGTPIDELFT